MTYLRLPAYTATFLFAFVLIFLSGAAFAMDVSSAKEKGLVGETEMGLLGIVNPPGTAELQALVNSTNSGRMDVYRKTAREQGITVQQAQYLMAKKLYNKTPSGFLIRKNGKWIKK